MSFLVTVWDNENCRYAAPARLAIRSPAVQQRRLTVERYGAVNSCHPLE